MNQHISHVEMEISEHHIKLDTLIGDAKALTVPKSFSEVVTRFQRDCELLKQDIKACAKPSTADFNDFADRRASLEVQFYNLSNQSLPR